jgi:threonine/homoserine/homoserine lactone efflux protein
LLSLDYDVLWTFAVLWLAIVPTPGANTLLIIQLALTRGCKEVAIALFGNLLGVAGYALATLLGLALLLAAAPSARLLIYALGGIYLLWVGTPLMRSGLSGKNTAGAIGAAQATPGRTFAQGLFTALSNVQALFFLASIFASTHLLKANLATGLAAIGIIAVGNGCYLALLAWLMQKPAARGVYGRYRPMLEMTFGALFVLIGVRLVLGELARAASLPAHGAGLRAHKRWPAP